MLTSRHKAHLIIITTFVLGLAVGASGHYLLSYQSHQNRSPSVTEVTDELARIVKLDQSQRSQVEKILNESSQQYQELKNQTRPQYMAIRDNTRKRIRAMLSAEQQALYDQWTNELDSKREKRNSEERKHSGK